jgi:pimeloyl-ACP methyl ester carboxylesterase
MSAPRSAADVILEYARGPQTGDGGGTAVGAVAARVSVVFCVSLVAALVFAAAPAMAAPGDIVSAGPGVFSMDPVLRLPMPGVRATHVVYRSTDVRGDPDVVSGTILVPTAPYVGKRPIVGYAVGTHGLGDGCAPSRQMADGVETESAQVMMAIARGWAVALTDYEGLGTPGQHTYVVGPSLGHAVLDAVRAASRAGVGLAADAPVLIWGYSEGGAAATWAAQLQPSYAPELRLLGTAAGGVPADVLAVARHLDGGAFFGFGVSSLMGLDAAFPQLDLKQSLNAAGRDLFARHQDDCLVQLLALPFTLNRYANLTTQDVLARPDVQAALAVSKLGASAPRAPMLLFHGRLDEVIPYEVGKELRDRYCALGAQVEWQTYEIAEHVVGSVISAPSTVAWLAERLSGQPVPDECAAVRSAARKAALRRSARRARQCAARARRAHRGRRARARASCAAMRQRSRSIHG